MFNFDKFDNVWGLGLFFCLCFLIFNLVNAFCVGGMFVFCFVLCFVLFCFVCLFVVVFCPVLLFRLFVLSAIKTNNVWVLYLVMTGLTLPLQL